jgi:hypothetical protein
VSSSSSILLQSCKRQFSFGWPHSAPFDLNRGVIVWSLFGQRYADALSKSGDETQNTSSSQNGFIQNPIYKSLFLINLSMTSHDIHTQSNGIENLFLFFSCYVVTGTARGFSFS